MGTTTTNLGLYKPANSEEDWGDDVNANWDTLDNLNKNVTFLTSGTLNVNSSHQVIIIDLTAEETMTVSLPSASSSEGQMLYIACKSSGGDALIDADGSDTINGDGSYESSSEYDYIIIVSDGVDTWFILSVDGWLST